MEFRVALTFLFLYYIRPQDWLPGFAGTNVIKPLIAIWLTSLFLQRERPRSHIGLLRTPHDWILLGYFIYVVFTAPDFKGTLFGFLPLVIFYVLTLKSLTSWERILTYIKWWNAMLVGIALLALMSLFGIDPTGAVAATLSNLGRLCIGTYMHDNPNALGHSVAVVIPLSYILYFWRGDSIGRFMICPALYVIAGWCIYLTQSKGAFLVSAVSLLIGFFVGRPKIVQLGAIILALSVGVSALSFLPRMNEMGNVRKSPGVAGRLMAWEIARNVSKTQPTGRGWGQFRAYIIWEHETQYKATHSSYVQVAADLGMYGMFFFVAVMWCGGKTLLIMAPYVRDNPLRERCRRAMMVQLLSFVISGWMINREYFAEYFLLLAVTAAMHRLMKEEELEALAAHAAEPAVVEAAPSLSEGAVLVAGGGSSSLVRDWIERGIKFPLWNKYGVLDFGVSVFLTWLVFYIWDYLLKNI